MEIFDHGTILDASTQLGVAAVTLGMAVLLLLAGARRSWNHWLAFFLLLVAGNFAFNGASLALVVAGGGNPNALDPATTSLIQNLNSLAFLCVIFDPAVLAYFASIFPRRTRLATHPIGVVLLAVPVLVLTYLEVSGRAFTIGPAAFGVQWSAFATYLAVCYGYASVRIVQSYLQERGDVMADQLRIVAFGFLVAIVPRIALIATDLRLPQVLTTVIVDYAMRVTLLALASLWLWRVLRPSDRHPRTRAHLRPLRRATVVVYALFAALWTADLLIRVTPAASDAFSQAVAVYLRNGMTFSIRWFVFASAMGYGIVRYQLLAVEPGVWQRGAATAAILGLGAGAALAGLLAGPVAAGATAAAMGAVGWGASATIRSRAQAPGYLHDRGLEVYRALLAAHLASDQSGEATASELAKARRRLGIRQEEHDALLAIAQVEETAHTRSPGASFGRYHVLKRLGAGGSASVYLARDADHDRLVVLKRIHGDGGDGAGAMKAALRELEVARRVSHPHLLTIHDAQPLDGGALVVSEYAEGGSVRDLLRAQGRLDAAVSHRIVAEALASLGALHAAGLVHGDLKPENILLDAEGSVKVGDFGIATASPRARRGATIMFGRAGTPAYMAPEVAEGQRRSGASDLYSLGTVAYELLTGQPWHTARHPWQGLQARLGDADGPAWEAWLRRVLDPEPARRPSASEAAHTLPAVGARERPKEAGEV